MNRDLFSGEGSLTADAASSGQNSVILLTAPGSAAIAVIRIHGPKVGEFLEKHFSRPAVSRRCVYGILSADENEIDDAVVVQCDDVTADLNVHGGTTVVRLVVDLAQREGFELIDGGQLPLPRIAVDAADALQSEIISYLPMARTELGVRMLLAQESAWADLIARADGHPDQSREELRRAIGDRCLNHLLNPPNVAIVGPPNVGKSTLANQLFAQQRSITADMPGTTRDWVGEIANVDGLPVLLLDTPGLRKTPDPIEAVAIDRSLVEIDQAALVILVLDATRPLEGEQSDLLKTYPRAILVINKCDCEPGPGMSDLAVIRTIATTGQGVSDLRTAIGTYFCGQFPPVPESARCWTSRQRSIAARAIDDLSLIKDLNRQHNRQ